MVAGQYCGISRRLDPGQGRAADKLIHCTKQVAACEPGEHSMWHEPPCRASAAVFTDRRRLCHMLKPLPTSCRKGPTCSVINASKPPRAPAATSSASAAKTRHRRAARPAGPCHQGHFDVRPSRGRTGRRRPGRSTAACSTPSSPRSPTSISTPSGCGGICSTPPSCATRPRRCTKRPARTAGKTPETACRPRRLAAGRRPRWPGPPGPTRSRSPSGRCGWATMRPACRN